MTKVEINPGVCGFVATVIAESDDEQMVNLKIESGCGGITKLAEKLGDEVDAFEVCLCSREPENFMRLLRKYVRDMLLVR